MTEEDKKIEKLLLEYDRADDKGKSYQEYYEEIFEVYFEPNIFDDNKMVE